MVHVFLNFQISVVKPCDYYEIESFTYYLWYYPKRNENELLPEEILPYFSSGSSVFPVPGVSHHGFIAVSIRTPPMALPKVFIITRNIKIIKKEILLEAATQLAWSEIYRMSNIDDMVPFF